MSSEQMSIYIYIVFLAVSFLASTVGAICGIGGGVIIKPVLDMFAVLDVSTISFLSGCTVLAMTCYSVGKAKWEGRKIIRKNKEIPLRRKLRSGILVYTSFFKV